MVRAAAGPGWHRHTGCCPRTGGQVSAGPVGPNAGGSGSSATSPARACRPGAPAAIRPWGGIWAGLGLPLALLLGGCATGGKLYQTLGPSYQPDNIHCIYPILPDQIRRVAVLPISVDRGDWQAAREREFLQSVLYSELGKAKRFELVAVHPGQLRQWSGAEAWPTTEAVPDDLLAQLERRFQCDAVLFPHLRPFRAYKPIVMGWNLKLIECRSQQIFWSADEVFDASDERVVRAAQKYSQQHGESWWQPLADPASILSSPRRFGQYTLSALFATLPAH